jgi:eukaryotic-like serine/threonine-protein kinase
VPEAERLPRLVLHTVCKPASRAWSLPRSRLGRLHLENFARFVADHHGFFSAVAAHAMLRRTGNDVFHAGKIGRQRLPAGMRAPRPRLLAFAWNGEKQNKWDIYVKQIGVEPPYRLTSGPAMDYSPVWSPDGRMIAFMRDISPGKSAIMLIPQRGGSERVLAQLTGAPYSLGPSGPYGPYGSLISWTPDSKWIVGPSSTFERFGGLRLYSTETGEQRSLTEPPADELGDTAPAVSPDGRTLAFSRVLPDNYNVALWFLHLGEEYKPVGKEEKIETGNMMNTGAAWLPDGSELVFTAGSGSNLGMWRVVTSNGATPQRINLDANNAFAPAVSRLGHRLAFVISKFDLNIWRIDLKGTSKKPNVPFQFIASTDLDNYPTYSPDGRRIAFVSQRSGNSDSDGTKATQLTSFGGSGAVYGPNWSPDSQSIAFTGVLKGVKDDIYSINANGGVPRRLTTNPAEDKWPYWSHDGNWIYFSSTRTGREEIWKMPSNGGVAKNLDTLRTPVLSSDSLRAGTSTISSRLHPA